MKSIATFALLLSVESFAINKTICGPTDDRTLSYDPRIGRSSQIGQLAGCTVTMIGRSCAISAGHCVGALEQVSFNVPHDEIESILPSKREDIYLRSKDFLRYKDQGVGDDWAVIRLEKNEVTGMYPGDKQGYYEVSLFNDLKKGDYVTITGYGIDTENDKKSFAQQFHRGQIASLGSWYRKSKLSHTVDTMGGNSGSSIIAEKTGRIVGIHSHGGCRGEVGLNKGTYIAKNSILTKVIRECIQWEQTLD